MHADGVWIPIILFTSLPVMVIGIPIARAYAKRIGQAPHQPLMPPELSARLERIKQALHFIAVEVERISEGQRFTRKLLADRSAVPNSNAPDPRT